jgi:signal transduction histidine kinase
MSQSRSSSPAPALLLPPLLAALDGWVLDPGAATEAQIADALVQLAEQLGLTVSRLRIATPPLPELDLDLGPTSAGAELVLRIPGESAPIGLVRLSGDSDQAVTLARALELAFTASRARARADRADRQLRALDQAVRGISGVLDLDRVLQLIVDRVRELVEAQYAALGIVDADGNIERFITSGISAEERRRIGALPRGRGLLGLIIRENRTYRIPDIAVHAERYGFPPEHPEMHSFLGMPIITQGATVGRLYLTNKLGAAEFSPDDQRLVEMFALHAGIAIENARLHDQVQRLAVVDERDRISRDLHDSVIQAIYAQTLSLDDVPELVTDDPGEARRRVDEAIDALHAVIRDIRNFIFGLRPVLLETGSLAEGIEHLATELRRNGGVEVEVTVDTSAVEDLPIELVAELLSIAREGLSNIARHASASRAQISLGNSGSGQLRLELSDDGRGFRADDAIAQGHHGLANMRVRTEALGGTFELSSGDGAGTRVIITLPPRSKAAKGDDQ